MVTRRRVLQFGLLGAGVLAVGGLGLSLRPSRLRSPKRPLKCLDPLEYSVFAAIADRVIPAQGKFVSPEQAEVAERVDDVLSRAYPWMQADFKKLVRLFENGVANLVLGGRPESFTRMSPEAQDAVLAAWADSSIKLRRTGYKALRGIVVAAYYGNPITYAAVGYPGPPDLPALGEPRALAAAEKLEEP